ncbi:MAG: hypothetical protein WEB58_05795 [Planctomycetaceae bacterium]
MKTRTVVIGCLGGGFVLLLLAGVAVFVGVKYYLMPAMKMPPELERPGILAGEKFLQKDLFVDVASIGKVTDILYQPSEKPAIGIAGVRGTVWVTPAGDVKSTVPIFASVSNVQFVDIDGDGTYELLNRGGLGWQQASLMDDDGSLLWTSDAGAGVDDMAAGDLDGDGTAEFVVGYNGSDGIHQLDKDGKLKWKQNDFNVWHVEVTDTDGDGTNEIVHSNAAGQITIRDAAGAILRQNRPEPYLSRFTLAHWPTKTDPQYLLYAQNARIWLYDFDAKTIADFDAPYVGLIGSAGETKGTPVTLDAGQPPYFAIVVEFAIWPRAVLSLYDNGSKLVYQEVLEAPCAALAALPNADGEGESLYVGTEGNVWKYTWP